MTGPAARPVPLPGLEKIAPYKPGDAGDAEAVKLSSNENALGASPKAVAAFHEAGERLHLYPEGSARVLREAIGARHELDPARIVCGAGSDELLQLLGRAFVASGDEVLYSAHGFLVYPLVARQCRATPVAAPERDLTVDVDAVLAQVTDKTRIVYIANPNNPTGTMLSAEEVRRLHAGLPGNVLLVLDAAYAEFVEDPAYEAGAALVHEAPNVVMTRTFSKIYGLAALRLGWMYGPAEVVDVIHRMRGPFNVSAPAIAAGAAAVTDEEHVMRSRAHNSCELARLTEAARRLGVLAAPSVGNFLLLRFPGEGSAGSDAADAFFRERHLILRAVKPYGLPDCLRLTVGREEENGRVIDALDAFMARVAA